SVSNARPSMSQIASVPYPRPRYAGRIASRRLAERTTWSISLSTISPRYSSFPPAVTARSTRPTAPATEAHHSSISRRENSREVPVSRRPSGSVTDSHIASASSARMGRRRTSSPWSASTIMRGSSASVHPFEHELAHASRICLPAGCLHDGSDDRPDGTEVAAADLLGDVGLGRERLVDRREEGTVVRDDLEPARDDDLFGRTLSREHPLEHLARELVVDAPG